MSSLTFSFWARFYDQFTSLIGFGDKFREDSVQIAVMPFLDGPARILDVGCGTGKLTLATATIVPQESIIYGIDPVPEMLEIARINRFNAGFRHNPRTQVIFELGRIENLPYPPNHFDIVLASMMTHHLDRRLKFCGCREIYNLDRG